MRHNQSFQRRQNMGDSRVEQWVGTESDEVQALNRQRGVIISVTLINKSKWRANRREKQIGRK